MEADMPVFRVDGLTIDSLLSIKQTCELLGVGRTTCYLLITSGDLVAVKIGRATRVRSSSVTALIDRSTVANPSNSMMGVAP
jgi:excisionase family DNA binding protein